MKKRLTHSEEFEIMKLVLDKFLWLGFAIMAYGLYLTVADTFSKGLMWIVVGAIVLLIFVAIIVKEFEFISG